MNQLFRIADNRYQYSSANLIQKCQHQGREGGREGGMVQIIIDLRYAHYRSMTEMNCVRCSIVVIVVK